jgi:hypothetical protein
MGRYIEPIKHRPEDQQYVDERLSSILTSNAATGGNLHSLQLGCLEGMIHNICSSATPSDRSMWLRRAKCFVVTTEDSKWLDTYRSKDEDDFVADRFCDLDLNADEREQL